MKGLIVEVEGKYAVLLNKKGQFVKIKNNGRYCVGQEADGYPYQGFNSVITKKAASIAAVLVLTSGLGYGVYRVPASYAYVDINPSVEIKANIFNRIIGVKAFNDEGKMVAKTEKILNESLQDGIKDIVAGAIEEGYLKEDSENVVVITVAGKDEKNIEKIEDESYRVVSKELEEKNLQTEIIVQSAQIDKKKDAEKLDISLGKLVLIEKVTAEDPAKKVEDLVKVPVKEIVKTNKIFKSKMGPAGKPKDNVKLPPNNLKPGENNLKKHDKDGLKPGEDKLKPGKDMIKPGEEKLKPGKDMIKPGEEKLKPGKDIIKPGKDITKTGEDKLKPGKEHMGPGAETFGPGKEHIGPGAEALGPGKEHVGQGTEGLGPGKGPLGPGVEPLRPGKGPLGPDAEALGPGRGPLEPGKEALRPDEKVKDENDKPTDRAKFDARWFFGSWGNGYWNNGDIRKPYNIAPKEDTDKKDDPKNRETKNNDDSPEKFGPSKDIQPVRDPNMIKEAEKKEEYKNEENRKDKHK